MKTRLSRAFVVAIVALAAACSGGQPDPEIVAKESTDPTAEPTLTSQAPTPTSSSANLVPTTVPSPTTEQFPTVTPAPETGMECAVSEQEEALLADLTDKTDGFKPSGQTLSIDQMQELLLHTARLFEAYKQGKEGNARFDLYVATTESEVSRLPGRDIESLSRALGDMKQNFLVAVSTSGFDLDCPTPTAVFDAYDLMIQSAEKLAGN